MAMISAGWGESRLGKEAGEERMEKNIGRGQKPRGILSEKSFGGGYFWGEGALKEGVGG